MQAVLLAAGASSRFFPFNQKHKCLVSVAGDPIIIHTVRSVKRAGITDLILIVPNKTDFQNILGNGKKYGVKITYIVFPKPTGAGNALLASSHLLKSDFFLINSNHIEFDELKDAIDGKRNSNKNAILLARSVKTEKQFGVLKVDQDKVLEIVEKPKSTKGLSNLRVIGVYFLNQEFVNVLKKTNDGHYNLEDALNKFAKQGNVRVVKIQNEVLSLKYPWDLLNVKNKALSKLTRKISKNAKVAKSAQIIGNVVVEEGAEISENAIIKGPAYIGRNTFVGSNSLVRNGSDLEEGSVAGAYMEVKNVLLGENSKTHSGHIEDSVVGQNSRIGALFTSANVRLDRENVASIVKGEKIDTGLRSFGAIIGSNTHIGSRVTTMPGTIIGNNSVIGPSTTVMKNIDSDTSYYTKFSEVIEKPAKSKSK